MATNETTPSRTSCQMQVPSARSDSAQTAASRRLRKREVDRRFQRESRERKRSHVAYLESLVEQLKQQDASGQVAVLLKQLKRTEEERDAATKTLKDIQQLIQRPSTFTISSSEPMKSSPVNSQSELLDVEVIAPNVNGLDGFMSMASDDPCQHKIAPRSEVVQQESRRLIDRSVSQATRSKEQHTTSTSSRTYDWINPQFSCCCSALVGRQPGRRAVWQGNFWKFIVDVLNERFDWTKEVEAADDVDSEDVPIRAMLEGWDAVADRAPLHPSWQILRRIDEAVFRPIPKTERLAMLRAMHLLLQYHTDPSAERYSRLPPWYIYRPSQDIAHTYAIDYYAWPHFRQRFIFNDHAYCGNGFFRMYQDEMRLLWPFEFRDCYTHDLETGLYKTSRLFDDRINDINCWTMGPDFFKRFPELSGVVPGSIRQIPPSLTPASNQTKNRLRLQDATSPTREIHITSSAGGNEEEWESIVQGVEAGLACTDWSTVDTAASSQVFALSNVQSDDRQALAFTQTAQDYCTQQPAFSPTASSSSSGWYNMCYAGFGGSLEDSIAPDISMLPMTSERLTE